LMNNRVILIMLMERICRKFRVMRRMILTRDCGYSFHEMSPRIWYFFSQAILTRKAAYQSNHCSSSPHAPASNSCKNWSDPLW
jgi:hypothetical protein